jgi:hypothetical protein
MSDELRSKLCGEIDSWLVPESDVNAVKRRGRSLVWKRRLATSSVVMVVAIVGVMSVATGWFERSDERQEHSGQSASRAEPEAAATVALDALTAGGESVVLRDARRLHDTWIVSFEDRGRTRELVQTLRQHRNVLGEIKRFRSSLLDEISNIDEKLTSLAHQDPPEEPIWSVLMRDRRSLMDELMGTAEGLRNARIAVRQARRRVIRARSEAVVSVHIDRLHNEIFVSKVDGLTLENRQVVLEYRAKLATLVIRFDCRIEGSSRADCTLIP